MKPYPTSKLSGAARGQHHPADAAVGTHAIETAVFFAEALGADLLIQRHAPEAPINVIGRPDSNAHAGFGFTGKAGGL
jgi:hypothetical protein